MNEYEMRKKLKTEFRDREYRSAYADDFLDVCIATQINVLREQRGLTQAALAELAGTKQPGVARMENANKRKTNLGALRRIAAALDVRLKVSFETFGSLLDEAEAFSGSTLERPEFEQDPAFWPDDEVESSVGEGGAVGVMRSRIRHWLSASAPSQVLKDWLKGAGLPAVGHEEEAFRWILRGLPIGAARTAAVATMARGSAELLEQRPDLSGTCGTGGYLYNLLQLSAALETPTALAGPLLALYHRLLDRSHLEPEVREALTAALIRNQQGQEMKSEWWSFLVERRHPSLPGNEFTGWAGVRRMPAVGDEPGARPDWNTVGEALAIMGSHLTVAEDRAREFERLLRGLLALYGEAPAVDRRLLLLSFQYDWPDWAKGAVPRLVVPDEHRDAHTSYLMAVPPNLYRFSWNPLTRKGLFEIVHAPERTAPSLAQFERAVLDCPEGSDRSFYNWLRQKVQILWRLEPEKVRAETCKRVHVELLELNGLAAASLH